MLESRGYVRIGLLPMNSGCPSVGAKINGHRLNLILDTGAGYTHLDRTRTAHIGLAWQERGTGPGRPVPKNHLSFTTVHSFVIGSVNIDTPKVYSYDASAVNRQLELHSDLPIDGLLGGDILDRHSAIIDYKNRDLFITRHVGAE
jgi:hypothetical protein